MSSPKFERVKDRYPGLASLLDSLSRYIVAQIESGQEYILPKLAAASLRLKDGEAFVLLEILAEGGVLRHVYNIYCRTNNDYIKTVDSLDALDEVPHCDYCDVDHDPSDLKVEVAFSLVHNGLSNVAA